MKSNVTVGPPIDLLAYSVDELNVTRQRRFTADDPDLAKIRVRWEQSLRQAILRLPELRFRPSATKATATPQDQTIELVEPTATDLSQELQPQQTGEKPPIAKSQ
jgi:putative proteasome-type protease